ncbi:MAG: aspartate kinase [Oligoflexia bacterium]|nr:aspartate kinase [Oligoflexia bacterium]
MLKVAKFGGTSVGTAESIHKIATIVAADPEIAVVVVSATAGTTNQLQELLHNLKAGSLDKVKTIFTAIKKRHLDLVHNLSLDKERAAAEVQEVISALEHLILSRAGGPTGDYSDSFRDSLLGLGEKLSVLIVAGHLRKQTQKKIHYVRAEEVIITDDCFGCANPLSSLIQENVRTKILPYCMATSGLVITEGYLGATVDGISTTLGRGGSDYTAALLARALDDLAPEQFQLQIQLQIWTDVSGIFTADPRIVPAARPLRQLSRFVAAELAYWGAKVLHPATLLPLLDTNVDIWVKNTFATEEEGTLIQSKNSTESKVEAITLRRAQSLVTLSRVKRHDTYGFLAKIFNLLTSFKISVDHVTTSEISTSFTVYDTSLLDTAVIEKLSELAEVQIENNLCLVSMIGNNLIEIQDLLGPISKTLALIGQRHNHKYVLRSMYLGAGSNNISFLVDEKIAETIILELHRYYLEKC